MKIFKLEFQKIIFLFFLLGGFLSSNAQLEKVKRVPGTIAKNTNIKARSATALAGGLQQYYSSTGRYTLSADGIGSTAASMNIRVNKPNAAATVEKAILLSSVTLNTAPDGCVNLNGTPVNWNGSASTSLFNSYWADVTSIVSATINAFPAGISTIPITECRTSAIDGEALLVIFRDPTATEKTIIIMVGAIDPLGDNFFVTLAEPIDPNAPGSLLDMGLGIGFGYQQFGGDQYSEVSVNSVRLTTSAGGEDDGASSNGALLTVGGIGDLNSNPTNPSALPANPRSDDELYNILPFITNTTTSLTINTRNPSNNDNIFLAYFTLSGAAIIGEGILLSQTSSSGNIGTNHTVKAAVLNSNGEAVPNRAVTFTILSGPNSGNTFTTNTNASGEAFYTYAGNGGVGTDNIQACFVNSESATICSNTIMFDWVSVNDYYSKPSGDLHNTATWGTNPDGSGTPPSDFGAGKTFHLVNRVPTYTMTADWTVEGIIDIPTGSSLRINGNTLTEAALIGMGSLYGSMTSSLVVMGTMGGSAGDLRFSSGGQSLKMFSLNRTGSGASVPVVTPLSIYEVLNIANGMLNTGNNITLKSTATNTARVAPVLGSISGNVTIERYIPARRAWRILSAPVGGTQSINNAWQEGATTSSPNPNPNPGFGTHVTQGSATNGFDFNPRIAMQSILRYVSATDTWNSIGNTNATPVNQTAFMVFVRGNRGVELGFNDVPPNNTVLRSMGPLKVGDQTFAVAASGFTAIPNPFASPINFATLTMNNVQNNFYVWDPKLGGPKGIGGYVLLSFNGSGYDITPAPVSPESQYIQSGQGFLVHSTGVAGSLVIKESDKSATPSMNVFRSSVKTTGIRATLQVVNKDRSMAVIDEAFTSYGASYSDNIDNLDAAKMPNVNENLGLTRNGQDLMVERRGNLNGSDTIFLKLWNTEQRDYVLRLTPLNLASLNLQGAYLVDNYLNTTTAIDVKEGLSVTFSVTENKASANAQRFMVVLAAQRGINSDITIKQGMFKMMPNPATGKQLQLQFINQPTGQYQFEIVNSLGQVIYKRLYKHAGGSNLVPINLQNAITKGIYQVQIVNVQANLKTSLSLISN